MAPTAATACSGPWDGATAAAVFARDRPRPRRGSVQPAGSGVVYPQLQGIDFRETATRLGVPVYLAEGRHELSARRLLALEWLVELRAPATRLVWFERSGHNPDAEEPAQFNALMIDTVLKETYPTAEAAQT